MSSLPITLAVAGGVSSVGGGSGFDSVRSTALLAPDSFVEISYIRQPYHPRHPMATASSTYSSPFLISRSFLTLDGVGRREIAGPGPGVELASAGRIGLDANVPE